MSRRDLREELDNWKGYAPAWYPEEGEMLVGTIEAYGIGTADYGDVRTVTIRDENAAEGDDPRVSVWLSRKVLLSEFERHQPQVGDRVGIKYVGVHEKGYHLYRLVIDRPEQFTPVGGERDGVPAESAVEGGKLDPAKLPLDGFDPKTDDEDDIPF